MLSSSFKKVSLWLLAAVLLGFAGTATAQNVQVNVMVSHTSTQPGPVERRDLLPQGFAPKSHRVLQSTTLNIAMNQEGSHQLPNGRMVKLRPSGVQGGQLAMHVEVQGATRSDLRMRNGKRVTIRHPEPYQGGNLLVHLEARF